MSQTNPEEISERGGDIMLFDNEEIEKL